MAPSGDSPSKVSREEQGDVKVTEPLLCTGCPKPNTSVPC